MIELTKDETQAGVRVARISFSSSPGVLTFVGRPESDQVDITIEVDGKETNGAIDIGGKVMWKFALLTIMTKCETGVPVEMSSALLKKEVDDAWAFVRQVK